MGASHNVFIGRVVKQVGTKSLNFGPETQFSVEVISSIKGNLSGTVTVNQFAGYKNGVLYLLKGDVSAPEKSGNSASEVDKLLEPGKTYLFASRYNSEQNWHTLVSHPNARKLISSDKKLTLTQLQGLVEKDTRVAQLREAYKNEILLDVDVASNNTRNSYVSTHPVTTSKSVPTTTKTK
ncbi:MAG: hypothetical protein A3B90_01160 [Candidatus Magasanikbacteria bacterium RIFCSPHIGHO2_02_FULL_41_13]|uniref:Uncharacterized protein n=1 Tax=Candidatus Magasanikbacteria bacterium RIFCSPHIGHO2_02_FULL_41_13 TaxID=1798676 RepID=A0A1F6M530_9BACT|nr:MAG: hypothetical protein A3B90_01160 [Candidatus Magasanikbacteria bacterium RIFCSPHIGHO2_02_FULL_41_13]